MSKVMGQRVTIMKSRYTGRWIVFWSYIDRAHDERFTHRSFDSWRSAMEFAGSMF